PADTSTTAPARSTAGSEDGASPGSDDLAGEFGRGWFHDSSAIWQVLVWASGLLAIVVASQVLSRRRRSHLVGYGLGQATGVGGGVLGGQISDVYGNRTAMLILGPPGALIGGWLIRRGAHHIRRDISLSVEEMLEEQEEARRILDDPEAVPALQVRNLDFSYGPVQVLFDVSFEVGRGEVVALLGTNGAGKSTLLRAVSGLGIPDRGVVRLNGRTVTYAEAETRYRVGIVQLRGGAGTFPHLTIEDNLRTSLLSTDLDRAEVDRRIATALARFPALEGRLDETAGSLSGGQQQMLALAMTLVQEPDVLLIDELSLGLAPVIVQDLLRVVEELKAEGQAMVIVEQSLNVALAFADRAVFMEKGQVRFSGPAQELLERGDLARAVFLGGEGG
ncbi:MAG: ABC transporter ATP-binding protein, partial [Actinobacteria bacterium]|nr:ABC transporter ATP-binding protein [Actinomycetota bacterium]